MVTPQSMQSFVDELEKTAGVGGQVLSFLERRGIPTTVAGLRAMPSSHKMLAGAGVGGLIGGLKKPGYSYDDQGNAQRHSRLGNIAKGALIGAGATGAGLLATKGGRDAAKDYLSNFATRTRYQFTGKAPGMGRTNFAEARRVGLLSPEASVADRMSHAQGWNTIPGAVKGLFTHPREMIGNTWKGMNWVGKVGTGLSAADAGYQALTPSDPGGPGKMERVLSSGMMGLGGLISPPGVLPSLALSGAAGAAGKRVGRVIDRAAGHKPVVQPPQVQELQPQYGASVQPGG